MILRGNLFSTTLGMETGLTVVGRNKLRKGTSYQVVYLLHGLGVNHSGWTDNTLLPVIAEQYNILFIMPEVSRSFYTDMRYGPNYFTYISNELPAICKTVFNISAKREDTAVIGGSMGGYGALKTALSKPEQYGFCGALAPACLFLEKALQLYRKNEKTGKPVSFFEKQLIQDFRAIFGEELVCQPEDELLYLARTVNEQTIKPRIYLACGVDDPLYRSNVRFAREMEKLQFEFTFRSQPGEHDWRYFNGALQEVLEAFTQK